MIRQSLHDLVVALSAGVSLTACVCSPADFDQPPVNKPVEQAAIESALIGIVSFTDEDGKRPTLEKRMAELEVRSASVAVFSGGDLHWASAYGEVDDVDTLFQAASLSKALAAVGIVALANEIGTDLDADLGSSFAVLRDKRLNPSGVPVTLRGLLSHSAGATISGFPGYSPDADIPSTQEIVFGTNGSNTAGIIIEPDRVGQRATLG